MAPYHFQLQSSPQRKVSKGKYYIPRDNTWSQETCRHGFFLMATRPGTILQLEIGVTAFDPIAQVSFLVLFLFCHFQLNYAGHFQLCA